MVKLSSESLPWSIQGIVETKYLWPQTELNVTAPQWLTLLLEEQACGRSKLVSSASGADPCSE